METGDGPWVVKSTYLLFEARRIAVHALPFASVLDPRALLARVPHLLANVAALPRTLFLFRGPAGGWVRGGGGGEGPASRRDSWNARRGGRGGSGREGI